MIFAATRPRQQLRARLLLVIGFVVSGGLLVLAGRRVDLNEAWNTASTADLGWLLVGVVGVNVGLLGMALRWRVLSASAAGTPAVSAYLQAILCAQGVNNVLPARSGDIVRIIWLGRATGAGAAAATASMLADRALDVLALGLVIGIGFAFVPSETWVTVVGLGALAGCVVLVAGWIACRIFAARREADAPLPAGRFRREFTRFANTLGVLVTWRRLGQAAGWTVMIWLTWTLGAWAVAQAIGIDVSPAQLLFVGAVLNVGLAIPSSPGFVGTYQWLIVAGLGLFAVGATQAFAFSVLLQLTWFVPQTVIGLVLLPRLGMSLHGLRHRTEDPIASVGEPR